jgi:radical SAM protein with 4Fe4S-binding SPASM domain
MRYLRHFIDNIKHKIYIFAGYIYKNSVLKNLYSGKHITRLNYLGRLSVKLLDFQWKSVKLHINNVCNLHCKNCYHRFEGEPMGQRQIFLFLDEVKKVIRNDNIRLDILGGEPLLRKDFMEIVEYSKKRIKINTVQLFTNAALINDDIAVKIRDSGVDIAVVPMHSHIEEIHDSITQCDGSWSQAIKGIRSLIKAGIRTYGFIIFMSCNVDTLKELELFVRRLGAKPIFFPYIKQRPCDDLWVYNRKKYHRSIDFAFKNSDKHTGQMLNLIYFRKKACPAFVNSITVKTDGTVTPCPFVNLKLGNINEQSFDKIVYDAYCNSRLIDFLSIPEECKPCSCVDICGGGCKAFRYQVYGDYKSKDINCSGPYKDKVAPSRLGEYIPYFF